MRRHRLTLVAAGLVAAVAGALAQTAAPPTTSASADARFDRVAAVVQAKMTEIGVPGVALGVLAEGQIRTRGFGVTNLDHPLPVTDDTLFQIGSISKTFSGTAIMRLVERGQLRLEDP